MRFDQLPTPFLTASTTRMAPVGGGLAIVETLGAKAPAALGVDFHFETTARSLVIGRRRAVDGVAGHRRRRRRSTFTGTVVLASGGYQGNAELMARYHGRPRHARAARSPAAATTTRAKASRWRWPSAPPRPATSRCSTPSRSTRARASPRPRSSAFTYGVLVNVDGERFVDEARGPIDAWYERTTRDIQAQTRRHRLDDPRPAGPGRSPTSAPRIRTDVPPVRGRHARRARRRRSRSTADDARGHGRGLQRGLPRRASGTPPAPTAWPPTGVTPPKSNWAKPIAEGPFVAYPIMAANVFTFGGLKDDATSRGGRPRRPRRSRACTPPAR